MSEQLTRLGVVQVSYASTYPGLGNKSKFPYFLRIVPPDTLQSEAVMDVVEAIKGEYVQILYSTCVCGSIAVDSLTAAGRARGICIAQSIEVAESDRYYEYYEMLRRKPHAKIVILYLSSQIVPNFIRDLDKQMAKGEFHFIGSNEWGKHMDLLQYPIAKGSLTVTLEIEPIRGMSSYIQNQVPRKEVPDPWLEQYIQARQNCYFSWSHDKTLPEQCTEDMLPTAEKGQFQTDCWCTFSATSMFVLLMGSAEYYSRVCGNTEKLCQDYVDNPSALMEEIQQLTMDLYGTGESKVSFTSSKQYSAIYFCKLQ